MACRNPEQKITLQQQTPQQGAANNCRLLRSNYQHQELEAAIARIIETIYSVATGWFDLKFGKRRTGRRFRESGLGPSQTSQIYRKD